MKLVRWVRFSWDLQKLPAQGPLLESHYAIRGATREEARTVRDLLISAFTLDTAWNDILHVLREVFEVQIEDAFDERKPCLVLTRGSRIVGASLLDPDPDAASHLVSGPAILNEYRNRGLGAALLYASLHALREAGLDRAIGVTKENVPTAKFLYTKFESVSGPCDFEPGLVKASS